MTVVLTDIAYLTGEISALRAEHDRTTDAAHEARRLAHQIKGDLGVIVGTLEVMQAAGTLTSDQRHDVETMQAAAERITEQFEAMHGLVRSIAPGSLQERDEGAS